MEQFRLEIKAYVHEKFSISNNRYTFTFEPQSIDNIFKGLNFAFLRFNIAPKWQLTVGKTWAGWGGIEFGLNPIYVYGFSDIIQQADNFFAGKEGKEFAKLASATIRGVVQRCWERPYCRPYS
ncbi:MULTISPECIES: porin [unclassified Lentimicrobium]|uniref:porin n=1 Tax=unclassified Lentimicrobium TaxID=2677434 RepID=UPI001556519C|nr:MULTISPECIES: porin [unclassified Lentimicrobium]NPD45366.1 hypothetical protein [Lentimicrobium sp. S6]NPD85267.1 hypothetical protein [Lentimicrobium sp. L6]